MARRCLHLAVSLAVLAALPPASTAALLRSHPHKHEKHEHEKHEKHDPSAVALSREAGPSPGQPAAAASQPGSCRSPQPGDKVVYFVRHELPRQPLGGLAAATRGINDQNLTRPGERQAGLLRMNPALAAALSPDERFRAQLVLTSPFVRTLQTALLGFGDLFSPDKVLINTDLMEYSVSDTAQPAQGEALLAKLGATDMLQQYRGLPEGWASSAGDHVERWSSFEKFLRGRQEERFIVVSHHCMIKRAGHSLNFGEVGISAFTPSGEWRTLDQPSCWPEFQEEWHRLLASRLK